MLLSHKTPGEKLVGNHQRFLAAAVATLALAGANVQGADNYPSRPIQMIIPFAAGGPTDIVGRVMAAKMGELLGQTLVVEDRVGGAVPSAPITSRRPRPTVTRC